MRTCFPPQFCPDSQNSRPKPGCPDAGGGTQGDAQAAGSQRTGPPGLAGSHCRPLGIHTWPPYLFGREAGHGGPRTGAVTSEHILHLASFSWCPRSRAQLTPPRLALTTKWQRVSGGYRPQSSPGQAALGPPSAQPRLRARPHTGLVQKPVAWWGGPRGPRLCPPQAKAGAATPGLLLPAVDQEKCCLSPRKRAPKWSLPGGHEAPRFQERP